MYVLWGCGRVGGGRQGRANRNQDLHLFLLPGIISDGDLGVIMNAGDRTLVVGYKANAQCVVLSLQRLHMTFPNITYLIFHLQHGTYQIKSLKKKNAENFTKHYMWSSGE